jgi:hypothetical protein
MRHSVRASGGWLPLAILVACAGCGGDVGDELPREAIWGTVTLDGKPIAHGAITFAPAAGQATQSGGVVTDGKFSVPRGQGPVPGKYNVSINSTTAQANIPASEASSGMPGYVARQPVDPIPEKYNNKTTLSAEVKKGGDNNFQFDLKTK